MNPASVEAWFTWMKVLQDSREPEGLTARQVAARLGTPALEDEVEAVLVYLASMGDLLVKRTSRQRFRPRPHERAIGHRIKVQANQGGVRRFEAFGLAVLEYQVDPRALQWSRLKDALQGLLQGRAGWPDDVLAAVKREPEKWLLAAAEIVPPTHVTPEDEMTRLRAENHRLRQEIDDFKSLRPPTETAGRSTEGGKKAELRDRAQRLEAEVILLRNRVAGLEEELEDYRQHDPVREAPETLIEGTGRGGWPDMLESSEVDRVRDLILSTRADRRLQVAFVRKVGEIFGNPRRFTRLTSQGFQQQRYDSLWRARVEGYRIVYGLSGDRVSVIEIKKRSEVYDDVQARL